MDRKIFIFLTFITSNYLTAAKLYVNVSGDITLGALFPVHKKGSDGKSCGNIQVSLSKVACSLGDNNKNNKKI